MPELNEVLVGNIEAGRLPGELPKGCYLASATVTMDRGQSKDRVDQKLRTPDYPVDVRYPDADVPYIPATTVWIENPALVNNRGEKIWENTVFARRIADVQEFVKNRDPYAGENEHRFYMAGMKVVEIPDKRVLVKDEEGRWRPPPEFFTEDHGQMSIGHFTKRPTITNEKVMAVLKDRGAVEGRVRQPLRLTRYDRVFAKGHDPSDSTRRYFSGAQAEEDPSVEAVNVRPHHYISDEAATKGQDEKAVLHDLQVGHDDIESDFPALSESKLWAKVTFTGEYRIDESFAEEGIVIHS